MKRIAIHLLIFMLAMSLAGFATAAQGGADESSSQAPQITSITIMDNAVEVAVSGDFMYTAYKPSDPFTVAVDLPDVDKGSFGGKMTSDKLGISEVKVSGTSAPSASTKLEILLESPGDIKAVRTDNTLLITIKKTEAQAMTEAASKMDSPMMAQAQSASEVSGREPLGPASSITGVSFDYSEGTLNLVIQGDGELSPKVFSLNGRIVIDFKGINMEAEMPAAVVAPVKAVRYGLHDGEVRMVVDLRQAVQFNALTEGDRLLISFPAEEVLEILSAEAPEEETLMEEAPKAAPGEKAAEEAVAGKYTGKIITLDFQQADIVPIFRFIGDISGYNVVVHPTVSGMVTLKLNNVPWDQALDIILNLYGLDKQVEGNIMTIAPASVFERLAKEKAQLKSTEAVTAELLRKVVHLEYIDAADMSKRISEEKALSPRGIMTVDEKGNNLRIRDTEESLKRVMEVVRDYDRPLYGKQQVMIEAKIILIDASYEREIGIDWSGSYGVQLFGTPVTGTFSVNQPKGGTATAAIPGVFTGIAPYASLDLTISALEDIGDSKTLANPRVLTIDGQQANIQSGSQIPVTTTTAEGSTTEFINANLSLSVTPTIKPNGIIEIKVSANKDEPIQVGGETGIETNSVDTTALVKDGQTLVLGGIYINEKSYPKSGIPGLRKIPILGWLFGTTRISESTDELMILITPTIMKGNDGEEPQMQSRRAY